jgi:hypothetical protein
MKNAASASVVVLTPEQLDALLEAAVDRARLATTPANDAPSALLDRTGLAKALQCSLPSIDRLRREGLPQLTIGDAPRFEIDAVLAWLRARSAGGGK